MPKQAFPAAAEGMPRINRRAILGGIASAPVVALPAVASAASENPRERILRLANELSMALGEMEGEYWEFKVRPPHDGAPNIHVEYGNKKPRRILFETQWAMINALQDFHGGKWLFRGEEGGFMLFYNATELARVTAERGGRPS
ncbi:hypothetical protein MIC97_13720 [Aquamicrobium sp. NLF2-7]|uniref:hypothetical protein n=1 Tax=Aquamicrobium sp. NLF2-7 TaxID=2918753 RepID=UPI001EFBB9EC|nr:hypothetical protein [Aquamicrobium sp. NLF2-7]MCG8272558.1 hypothetical protein [Aquamicrobium sp. NLF2-7]